jgi:hypothetical protein
VFLKSQLAGLVLIVMFMVATAASQVTTGAQPFGSFGGGPFDTVNLGNLNVHFSIPVIHKAGRGMPFTYDLSYDSSLWSPVDGSGNNAWTPVPNWGWRGVTEVATGYSEYTIVTTQNGPCNTDTYTYRYHDNFGVSHLFGLKAKELYWPGTGGCTRHFYGFTNSNAVDGSGYILSVTSGNNLGGTLTSRSGKLINPPLNTTNGAGTAIDANGNQIKVDRCIWTHRRINNQWRSGGNALLAYWETRLHEWANREQDSHSSTRRRPGDLQFGRLGKI